MSESFCQGWSVKTSCQALCPKPLGTTGQNTCRWSQGQENLIEEICLDCELHLTVIHKKCTDTAVLSVPAWNRRLRLNKVKVPT